MIQGLVAIFLASILTENYILSKFLGICPFLGVSKKVNTAVGMSVAVTFVMVLSTAVTWPIYTYLLVPNDLAYLQTIVFILIIAALVQLVEIVLRKYIPSLYNALGIYLPLITTNCAVLGVTMLVLEKGARRSYLRVSAIPGKRFRFRNRLPGGDGDFCRRPPENGGMRYSRNYEGPAHHISRRLSGRRILPRLPGFGGWTVRLRKGSGWNE